MSRGRDELALRKDLLRAQSAVYRAQLRVELEALRAGITRGGSWIGRATALLSVARTVFAVLAFLRR